MGGASIGTSASWSIECSRSALSWSRCVVVSGWWGGVVVVGVRVSGGV